MTLRMKVMSALAALAISTTVALTSTPAQAAPPEPQPRATLANRAYFNDPNQAGRNTIRDVFITRINQAPKGSTIRVSMFNIDDDAVIGALKKAYWRGVHVKVVTAARNCDTSLGGLIWLGNDTSKGSFYFCKKGSRSGRGGHLHTKWVTFSKTGGTPWVTLVGSANMTEEAWRDQWTDMFQYANRKDVHAAHVRAFTAQAKGGADGTPYLKWTDVNGKARAVFMPINHSGSAPIKPGQDPAYNRLREMPANRNTRIVIANYATWGARAGWITDQLVRMKKRGAHIRFIGGPPTNNKLEAKLRRNGIPVTRAFDCTDEKNHVKGTTCNYIHLKAMTASYRKNGKTVYFTWTGSDNWASDSLRNDENIMRIGGPRIYNDYNRFFSTIEKRY